MAKENIMGRDREHRNKWEKETIRKYNFGLNKEKDKDVLAHLEKQKNKRQYLIDLIKADMKKKKSA